MVRCVRTVAANERNRLKTTARGCIPQTNWAIFVEQGICLSPGDQTWILQTMPKANQPCFATKMPLRPLSKNGSVARRSRQQAQSEKPTIDSQPNRTANILLNKPDDPSTARTRLRKPAHEIAQAAQTRAQTAQDSHKRRTNNESRRTENATAEKRSDGTNNMHNKVQNNSHRVSNKKTKT